MRHRSGVYRTLFITLSKFCEAKRDSFSTINLLLNSKNQDLNSLDNAAKIKLLLYGTEQLDFSKNKQVLNATINFIKLTERLNQV